MKGELRLVPSRLEPSSMPRSGVSIMTIIQAIILAIVVAGYNLLALVVLWRFLRNVLAQIPPMVKSKAPIKTGPRIVARRSFVESSASREIAILLTFVLSTGSVALGAQSAGLKGRVTATGPQGEPQKIAGAKLCLSAGASTVSRSTVSDEEGEYTFSSVPPGSYTLEVSFEGFKKFTRSVTIADDASVVADIELEIEDLREEVSVSAGSNPIDVEQSAPAEEIKQSTLQTVPLANERFQNALPLIPGVVRGPDGLLNIKGARASQSGLTVNSANVTDPVTGEFAINLPIEAIQSVQVIMNPYAPEYGKFAGGITNIETRQGSDRWKFQVQDFLPRLRHRDGTIAGIESATPRIAVGGPVVKERVKLLQSFQYNFIRTRVEGLPPLASDTRLESFDSFTQVDWEIDSTNHFATSFSIFPQRLGFVGLNTFNPQEVTPNFKQRGFFWAASEQKTFASGALLQSFVSVKQFDADIFPSSGVGVMKLAPDVNSGSFFNSQDRNSRRFEALEVYNFSPHKLPGSHSMKVAVGFSHDSFDGSNRSSAIEILRANGTLSQQIDFAGEGVLHRNKSGMLAFFQDKWSVNSRLTFDYGVRYDRDSAAAENNIAPRLGFALLPLGDGRTVIRGGIGLFYDKVNLNVATFDQLQERISTRFATDGEQVIDGPVRQRLVLDRAQLGTPRSVSWNIEVDREWMKNLFVRVGYQQREGRREYVLDSLEDLSLLQLGSHGSSRYQEFQATARYRFRESDQFSASYIRSKATGDLNDFNSLFGNFENPVIQPNERSRLPWDAPNRFLFWGDFNVVYGISVAPVVDIHNGFPISITDEDRNFVGPRNRAGRFPTFGSLDLQALKSVAIRLRDKRYKAKVGLKIFNITNRFNPRDFQGNQASSEFGGFFNGVSRSLRGKFVVEF